MSKELDLFLKTIDNKGAVLGLANMRRLMEQLGNVQNALPIIHIAGTNGKGSVGCYLASLCREAGLTVGRYVSPAVFSPYETTTINGDCITAEEYSALMDEIRVACEGFSQEELPTRFEADTALAYLWFSKKSPDIVLVECGMGGETDATNVMKQPLASVITSISMDHVAFLGDTLEKIAKVKAGIIKDNCPVFSAAQNTQVMDVLQSVANEKNAQFTFVNEAELYLLSSKPGSMMFQYRIYELKTQMAGHYQMMNVALAIEVYLGAVCSAFSIDKPLQYIMDGIEKAVWPGRFQVISENPLIIMDGAHNEAAALELSESLTQCFGDGDVVLIMGVLKDKDYKRMLELLLPHASYFITVTPDNNPRAFDGKMLLEEALGVVNNPMCSLTAQEMEYAENYGKALQKAIIHDKPILICGSLSYLGGICKEL